MYENVTVEQAAELLARRKVASAQVGGFTKHAEDWGKTLFGADPTTGSLRNLGIGAGAGALLGGLSGWWNSDEDDGAGGALRGALRGGAVGGAVGGGTTMGYHAMKGLANAVSNPTPPEPKPGEGSILSLADSKKPPAGPGVTVRGSTVARTAGGGILGGLAGKGLQKAIQIPAEALTATSRAQALQTFASELSQIRATGAAGTAGLVGPATKEELAMLAKMNPIKWGWFMRNLPGIGAVLGAGTAFLTEPPSTAVNEAGRSVMPQ